MLDKEILYTLNDVAVIPAASSCISSRSETDPYYNDKMTALFVAPMLNIINDENWKVFKEAKVNTILPRDDERIDYNIRKIRWESYWHETFVALSLREFKQYFIDESPVINNKTYVCVDLANGHMKSLIDMCKKVKLQYKDNVIILTGNIANPETYKEYAKAGIDYVRCGIGTGSICTTAANSSIHYPMASLIDKCKCYKNSIEADLEYEECHPYYKSEYICAPKIIADGGFTNYDQIIKALALGADYCMCGKLFAQCIEACTSIISDKDFVLPEELDSFDIPVHSTVRKPYNNVKFVLELINKGYQFHRDYYGMSTKRAQREMGGSGNKTAEGIAIQIPVKQTVAGWVDNFIAYLKSAMSYTECKTLYDFIGGPVCKIISANSYSAYFK